MSLPILTEDEIFSPSVNPPSSQMISTAEDLDWFQFVDDWEEPDGPSSQMSTAEDLDWFQFVDDWEEPDEPADPGDHTDLEVITTPSMIAVDVHLEAIGALLSMPDDVVKVPDDPHFVTHSVASLPNVGISQTEQEYHHHRLLRRGPRPVISEPRWHTATPVAPTPKNGLKGLMVPRSQLLEFAKFRSHLLFPLLLPKCTGKGWPDMPCMYPEPQMPVEDVLQASVAAYPQPIQQFSQAPSTPAPSTIQFSAPSGTDFAFATPLQPQQPPNFEPPTNFAPAQISTGTMVTTARMVNMMNTGEAPTGGVDMSTRIEISHRPQVEITTPRPPTIPDLSSLIMTAPGDLDVSFTPHPMQHGYFSGAAHEQSSGWESLFMNSSNKFTWSNRGSPIDWPNAIDHRMPPPQLEFPLSPYDLETLSPYRVELLPDSPGITMMTEEISPTMVPEQVPELLVPEQHEGSAPASESNSRFNEPFVKPTRLKWNQELHKNFVEAVAVLEHADSKKKATPKNICQLMKCPEIDIFHIKSHLQKYRINPDCFDYGSPLGSPSSEGSLMSNKKRPRNRGPNASHSEQTSREVAEQEKQQQRLWEVLEKSKEMQLKIIDVMDKKEEELEKQGEQLQRMLDERQAMMGRLMGEAPAEAAAGSLDLASS